MGFSVDSQVLTEIINGFIRSVTNALDTMAFTKISRSDVYLKKPGDPMRGDVSTIISLFGDLDGTCAMSFPESTAIKVIGRMMMDENLSEMDEEVQDGLGEITNLTAGGGKSEIFNILGTTAKISVPTIITGENHIVEHKSTIPCIGCEFETDLGIFYMEIAVYKS